MTPRDWTVLAVNAIGAIAIITAIVYAVVNRIINVLRRYENTED